MKNEKNNIHQAIWTPIPRVLTKAGTQRPDDMNCLIS